MIGRESDAKIKFMIDNNLNLTMTTRITDNHSAGPTRITNMPHEIEDRARQINAQCELSALQEFKVAPLLEGRYCARKGKCHFKFNRRSMTICTQLTF